LGAAFFTVRADPHEARWARHFVAAEQLAAGGIVGGNVQAQQAYVFQGIHHLGFAEHLLFHDLARHAPVGVIVHQHPLALSLGAVELALQHGGIVDGHEGIVGARCGGGPRSAVDLQRLPQVIAATGGAHHQQCAPQAEHQGTGAEHVGGQAVFAGQGPAAVGHHQRERAPQADPQAFIDHRADHQHGGAEEQEAEDALEHIHPGARLGQEAIAHGHQQQQRNADADAHGEQDQATV